MQEALSRLQRQLEGTFAGLRDERTAVRYPVYALEHGLDVPQLDLLKASLAGEFARRSTLDARFWLLWVVLAAEVGYSYDGDEYWRSFAEQVPGCTDHDDREKIRDWFRRFAVRFNGFEPEGRWAEHFSIIAWPITHSILPVDLQGHFARLLYDLRYELARSNSFGPEELGNLLCRRAANEASRFGTFLQQTSLTGRLVFALRDEGIAGVVSPISGPTLARIIKDLERRRAAREWLNEARRVFREVRLTASPNLRPGGVSPGRGSDQEPSFQVWQQGAGLAARRGRDGSWSVGVKFPNFRPVLQSLGIALSALDKTRIRMFDNRERWMPGRGLLNLSGQEQRITALPDGAPLVVFERPVPQVEGPLAACLSIKGRSPWLLRVHADGIARQVQGHHVRPSESYALIAREPIADQLASALGLRRERDDPELHIYGYTAPPTVDPDHLRYLTLAGLGFAVGARIEPVGLLPRWDAQSSATEWLTSEEVILRLSADYPVREFAISVDGRTTRVPAREATDTICALGRLPAGMHTIEVAASPSNHSVLGAGPTSSEVLLAQVRPARGLGDVLAGCGGVKVAIDPVDARFEDVLAGRAAISVIGPSSRTVTVFVEAFDTNGHLVSREEVARKSLPFDNSWTTRLANRFAGAAALERLQASPWLDVVFSAEELGSVRTRFAHTVKPLRWRLEAGTGRLRARLVNEAGNDAALVVHRYDVTRPDHREPVPTPDCYFGIPVAHPGMLLVARLGDRSYPTLVSVAPHAAPLRLEDLKVRPCFDPRLASPRKLTRLIALMRLWKAARTAGPLAAIYQAQILRTFRLRTAEIVCGRDWSDGMAACLDAGRPDMKLDKLQKMVGMPGFALLLREQFTQDRSPEAAGDFGELAKRYKVCSSADLCAVAWRVAFSPMSMKFQDPRSASEAFELLAANQLLARGAFFARTVADVCNVPDRSGSIAA